MSSHHHHAHQHSSSGNLRTAFFLNLAFTVIEVAGGLWTNSIAILTDALHDAGDSASLGLAWYFDRLSARGRTPRHTYGYQRYRLLGGLITGLVLAVGLGIVLWHAVGPLLSPQRVNATGMIALAVVGIIFNGAAVLRVRGGTSLTEKVVSWHLLEDTLGWVAVLVGSAAMAVWDVPVIDPILSVGISLFILWNVIRNLRQVMAVFLQTAPESFELEAFERAALKIPKVLSAHHTHSWSLDGESHVLSTHLVMEPDSDREQIVEAKRRVQDALDPGAFAHVTIDVELEGEECAAPARRSEEGKPE